MTKKEIVQYLKQNMPTFTGNKIEKEKKMAMYIYCLLYTSPSPRDGATSRMPSSA